MGPIDADGLAGARPYPLQTKPLPRRLPVAQKVADGTGRDHVAVDLQTAALERQTADTFQTLNAVIAVCVCIGTRWQGTPLRPAGRETQRSLAAPARCRGADLNASACRAATR